MLIISSTLNLTLQTYVDADWTEDISNSKATSGFCVYLAYSWRAKKQHVIASFGYAQL